MSYKKIFWGVVFIAIGVLFVLRNTGAIYFSWGMLFSMWPLLLILWGISLIPVRDVVKLLISVLTVVAGIWLISQNDHYWQGRFSWNHPSHNNFHWDVDVDDEDDAESYIDQAQELSEDWDGQTEKAFLHFDAAAGRFYLDEVEGDHLIEFEKRGELARYNMVSRDTENGKEIRLTMEKHQQFHGNPHNMAEVRLHPQPIWDLDLDVGAAKVDLDLSPFKLDRLNIDGGASSIRIKLGAKRPESRIKIDSGVSSVTLRVPESSGCEILTDAVLSTKNLLGFEKIGRGKYRTANFDTADAKIFVEMDVAISSLHVSRY